MTGEENRQLLDFSLAGAALALQFRMSSIAEDLERVREQIASAAANSGRSTDDVELVAISKTCPAEKVREAVEAGQTLFGESRVQEARSKIPELSSNLRWHFVGHLQKNKVRQALPLFEMIHSVHSLELAQDINRVAEEEGLHPRVLLEVNVAGEGSKFGFAPDNLRKQMEALLALPRLLIEGLMCIPPLAVESEDSRRFFVQVRKLRDSLAEEFRREAASAFDGHDARFPNWNSRGCDACPRWDGHLWRAKSEEGRSLDRPRRLESRRSLKDESGKCVWNPATSNKSETSWPLPGTTARSRSSNLNCSGARVRARVAAASRTCSVRFYVRM